MAPTPSSSLRRPCPLQRRRLTLTEKSRPWPVVMFVYMTALAYAASLITYEVAKTAGLG